MKLKMTADDALNFADEWSRGLTLHEHSEGWRVVCLVLANEVRTLRDLLEDADHALGDLGACDDSECAEPNCLKVRQRIADILP